MSIDIYEGLVDIRDVSVDRNLSQNERIIEFIRQIKNPYRFRCGKFIIKATYDPNGPSIEKCLHRMMV